MTNVDGFVRAMTEGAVPIKEQAVGIVWLLSLEEGNGSTSELICAALESAGHAQQNRTRLRSQLEADSRVVRRGNGFSISARHLPQVSKVFENFSVRKFVRPSNSVLPKELFDGTRGYIERVVAQINGSYDYAMHDCCAVMCRRLGETLIIELYEALGRAPEIKAADGNFLMLNGLLGVLFKDTSINLGRNSKKGLEELKELGDKSAHNRRFNARQSDIDGIRSGLRTAAEELLHLAKLT